MPTCPEACHVVVVGAGEAGARLAHELHAGGWPGPITLLGEEDRPVYERPPLSKNVLVDDEPSPVEPYREGRLEWPGLTVRTGVTVRSIDRTDRTVRLADGEEIAYDRLVIATGARSRRLPGLAVGVHTLRTWDEALQLRSVLHRRGSLLVIGAGLIGLEVAASARSRGMAVTVVEMRPRALERAVPEPVAEVLAERHRAEGVSLHLGTTVESLEQDEGGWLARLSDGTEVTADAVVAAVGSVPETALAKAAGLPVDDGILVDGQMRTSDEHVWAIGDCCAGPVDVLGRRARLESWRMAHDQAVTAAAAIRGEDVRHTAVPWFWSDQYDLSLQVAGAAAAARSWVRRPHPDGSTVHLGLDEAGRVVCAAGAGGPRVAKDVRMSERLITSGTVVDPGLLADADTPLKSLLRS
ncbi:NAD(P)/FAD-dependent oxidoreductase [Janibacter alittae]|uniref:FAD-dependent oxidoreductase n=1 Tax=Janibacter alittae TaxID=3115209 RepID=A0ABZ2MH31_9MICO